MIEILGVCSFVLGMSPIVGLGLFGVCYGVGI